MKTAEIKEIIELFQTSSLSYLKIEEKDSKITLEQKVTSKEISQEILHTEEKTAPLSPSKGLGVKAPLVGVFYQSNAPGEPPFATLGQLVKKGDVLCLIEAMKIMNEIKSPITGRVISVLAKNEELVSFDQVLFEIEEEPC